MKTLRTVQNALLLAAVVLTAGCSHKEAATDADAAVNVREIVVGSTPAASAFSYSGTAEEDVSTPLSFAVGGTVGRVCVKVGDRVSRGQLVATIDDASLRHAHDIAATARRQAEDAHSRMKVLHERGSLPEIKWVEAESQLAQAVASEEIAAKNLADCRLYAPAAGVVSARLVEPGQNVMPGTPVVSVAGTQVMNVAVSIPEQDVAAISKGDRAVITVPALSGRTFEGTVTEKGIVADPLSRSYKIKIRVGGAAGLLLPGMVAKVALEKAAGADDIVIPASLLSLADDGRSFVWVDKGGRAERRYVVGERFTADGVVIASGLSRGDRVISEGRQKVCTGTRLSVTK